MQLYFAGDLLAIGAPEDRHRKLGAARSHQSGDADHFALPHVEADILDHLPLGMQRMIDVPIRNLEHRLADLCMARRVAVGQLAPHHRLDDAVLVDLFSLGVECIDRLAIADHRDAVGDLHHLIQLVGDEHRRDALRPEALQQFEQRIGIGFVEARRRLVEDQQLDRLVERFGDFNELLLAGADVGDQRVGVFLEANLFE